MAIQPKHSDIRHIACGLEIPTEGYCDQPYIVKTDDGAWLCVETTCEGREGQNGQHVITLRSTDQGRSWSDHVDVEPADGPEASYAVLLKAPSGRIFCFYNHNTDNIRAAKADDPPYRGGYCTRVDSLGYFVFKYSDDQGRSWSSQRYVIPIREMDIDRKNVYNGEIRFFWNVGKPFIKNGEAYVSVHKVGGFGHGFFTRSEGVLVHSPDLLALSDSGKASWETLPNGEYGLRTPPGGGPIAEEQSYSVLSDGSFFVVYRTVDGHPVCAYSRDNGHTWSEPEYMKYADGRLMKHPRAANFAWRCSNGQYLYWFHNHGGCGYEDRNPVWLSGGVEVPAPGGAVIAWSQPEIVLYEDDPLIRMSYPDLVEDEGRYYLTETQKETARVHELDTDLLTGLWNQFAKAEVINEGLVLALPAPGATMPPTAPMPALPMFIMRDYSRFDHGARRLRTGFTIELWVSFASLAAGQILLDSRAPSGQGLALFTVDGEAVEIVISDGNTENHWTCDPGMLQATGDPQHIVAIVDGGTCIIAFVVNGRLCDGGTFRQFGWGRFSPHLRHVNGAADVQLAPNLQGRLHRVRIYGRGLRVSEAVASFRAGVV